MRRMEKDRLKWDVRRQVLVSVPGQHWDRREFLWAPHIDETDKPVAAAKILWRRAPGLAIANRLPRPADMPGEFEEHPARIPKGVRRAAALDLRNGFTGMAGALRRGERVWTWWPKWYLGYPSHQNKTFPGAGDRMALPVSQRAYGWAVSQPLMLALAHRDYLWRALVLHHLWLLSGRPEIPADAQ